MVSLDGDVQSKVTLANWNCSPCGFAGGIAEEEAKAWFVPAGSNAAEAPPQPPGHRAWHRPSCRPCDAMMLLPTQVGRAIGRKSIFVRGRCELQKRQGPSPPQQSAP